MAKYNGKKIKYGDTIYWEDELNDDFEPTKLKRNPVPENYEYVTKSKVKRFFTKILYFGICGIIIPLIVKCFGVKIKYLDKEGFKEYRKHGGFIYSNHTSFLDMIDIQTIFLVKKTRIVGYTDALDMPIAKHIVKPLGFMPLPDTIASSRAFMDALRKFTDNRESIIIYPEAHVWPYYTKIRPFVSTSFKYPVKLGKPALPITACYRKSKISKHAKITLYVGKPVYPKPDLSLKENTEYLHSECYKQMVDTASKYSTYEFIKYKKKEKNGEQ